jgi:hypothetical protein
LGGEPDYEQRFASQVKEASKLLAPAGPDVQVTALSDADASKARIQETLGAIARKATKDDSFLLVLIGHGTFDGEQYKFNIPGPDIADTELASLLDRIPAGQQLVVNATSASGASAESLARADRLVVTATKSGTEKNATVFARYWIEALRDPASDTDKNEVISALEAFRFAEAKTKSFYETQKRLATEHASLSGGGEGNQGAARFALLRIGAAQAAAADPAKRAILDKREELEAQIDNLKFRKAAMPTEEYREQLQKLLLELARTQAELDQ